MLTFDFLSGNEIAKHLGERVKVLRLADNMSRDELARRAGISGGTLRRFEAGQTVSLENFIKLVIALGRARELSGILSHEGMSISQIEKIASVETRKRASRKMRR